ncbi:MAG: hypothetical protein K9M84_12820 [Spirochaetia bacterium]|nr:hypothetical protein [Spirochaetia bacterium]
MGSHQRIFSWIASCKRQEKVTHGCSACGAGSTAGVSEQKSSLGHVTASLSGGSPLREADPTGALAWEKPMPA